MDLNISLTISILVRPEKTFDVDELVKPVKNVPDNQDNGLTVGDLKGLIQSSSKKEIRVLKDIFHAHMDEQIGKLRCKHCGELTKLESHVVVIESKENNDREMYFCSMKHLSKWLRKKTI